MIIFCPLILYRSVPVFIAQLALVLFLLGLD